MKKTMIALALAATAVSGSAMAWTVAGTGGNIELGGSIQVTPYSTPWEVMVGAPATGIDASITKGTSAVVIPVTNAIPVLGIRTVSKDAFLGIPGMTPQIDYGGAVKLDGFVKGITTLNLLVVDADNPATEIGEMSVNFAAAAKASQVRSDRSFNNELYASGPNSVSAFFGGLPLNSNDVASDSIALINTISPSFTQNFNSQGLATDNWVTSIYFGNSFLYGGFYGAGIQAGSDIKLTLNTPAANDVIKWKASLPITVSYQ